MSSFCKNCVEKHAVTIIWCFGSYEPFNSKYIYIEYVSNIIKQMKEYWGIILYIPYPYTLVYTQINIPSCVLM